MAKEIEKRELAILSDVFATVASKILNSLLKFRAKNAVVDPDLLGNLTSVMTKTSAA